MPNPTNPDSPFGAPPELWTEEDELDPSQSVTNPSEVPPDDANDIAQQWVGEMTRIGPELYLDDKTASQLSAMKALGIPMSSPDEVLFAADLLADSSILTDHISWFNAIEWAMLVDWLDLLPSKVSYSLVMSFWAQVSPDPKVELLKALNDLHFVISPGNPKTVTLLKLIGGSGSQSSQIAQQILAMDPASITKLLEQYDASGLETGPVQMPGQKPSVDLETVMRKHHPEYGQAPKAPAGPAEPPSPAESSNPEIRMTMPEVNKWGVDPMPSKIPAGGAQQINKQIADFTHNYEDRLVGLPKEVKPAPYGERIPRQQVFPAGGSKKGLANVPVTGGMFLKDNKNGRDAQAIGLASDGMLAVRLIPGGEYDQWDLLNGDPVEVSAVRPPKRNY